MNLNNGAWIIERDGSDPPRYVVGIDFRGVMDVEELQKIGWGFKSGVSCRLEDGYRMSAKASWVLRDALRFETKEQADVVIGVLVRKHWCNEGDLVAVLYKG